jgi:hypothetical protein
MVTRVSKAFEDIQFSINQLGVLHDAFHEVCGILRQAAIGTDISKEAAMLLQNYQGRNLLHSTFFSPSEVNPQRKVVVVMCDLLNEPTPPVGTTLTEANWFAAVDIRRGLAELCSSYPDQTAAAIDRRSLRPWFVTKLFQSGFNHTFAHETVMVAFGEAARRLERDNA